MVMSKAPKSFSCRWSGSIIATTIICTLAFTAAIVMMMVLSRSPRWLGYFLAICFAAVLAGCIGFMPIRIVLHSDRICLHRLFGALTIRLDRIEEIRPISESEALHGAARTFGSGGLFGALGRFRSKTFGNFTMYATDLDSLILIRAEGRNYILSCSRRNDLIESVSSING